jgi:hypothetical protein
VIIPPINVVVPSKHELNFACAPSTRGERQRLKGVSEDGAHERQCEENAAENRRRDQEARGAHGGLPLLKLGLVQVNERTNSPFRNHLGPCGQHKRKSANTAPFGRRAHGFWCTRDGAMERSTRRSLWRGDCGSQGWGTPLKGEGRAGVGWGPNPKFISPPTFHLLWTQRAISFRERSARRWCLKDLQ